jgi:hypothetical protein
LITQVCQYLRNWFERDKYIGSFEIKNGVLSFNDGEMVLLDGQYYRIINSVFNDGVHKAGDLADTLADESFTGAVWAMGVPKALLALVVEIEAWQAKYGSVDSQAMSPFSSESFGGYSYTKSAGDSASGMTTWQSAFSARLAQWRKL